MKRKFPTTAALADAVQQTSTIANLSVTLKLDPPREFTRPQIHEFVNAVRLAVRDLFQQEPELILTTRRRRKNPKP
jgi:hypothetical protein